MAKKLIVLVVMAVLLAAAVPALAQEGNEMTVPVGATGDTTTVNFELTVEGTPPADATFFAQTVQGNGVQLTDPDGDGVYTGSFTFETQIAPEGIPFVIVQSTGTRSTPLGERPGAPQTMIRDFGVVTPEDGDTLSASVSFSEEIMVNFELTVEGTPPADAMFFGCGEFPVEQLTDPDGDGLYTGSVNFPVSDFTSEPRPFSITQAPDVVPACMVPVRTEDGYVGHVIQDFGLVPLDEDKTLSASVSFFDNDGSGDNGGSTSGGSDIGSSGSGSSSNGGGPGSVGSGSGSAIGNNGGSSNGGKISGQSSSGPGGTKILPATGGLALPALGVGVLLVAGGLLVRKISR